MGQFSKVLLTIDNVHTVPQKALVCKPGLGSVLKPIFIEIPLLNVEFCQTLYLNFLVV